MTQTATNPNTGEKVILVGGRWVPLPKNAAPTAVAEDPTQGFKTTLQFGPVDTGLELPEGLSVGLAGAGKRLKDIFTLGLNEREGDAALMERPEAVGGAIATDLAVSVLPMLKAGQALQATNAMSKLGPAASSLLSNAAVSGAYDFATRPGDILDRAGNAAVSAGTSILGEGALRVGSGILGGPLRSTSVTPEAKKLIAEGVPVPPWKATTSERVRDFAERAKGSVMAKKIISGPEREAIKKWNMNLVQDATPPVPVLDDAGNVLRWKSSPVKEIGDGTLNTIRQRFDDAYDALYRGRVIPLDDGFRGTLDDVVGGAERYYPESAGAIKGIVQKVKDTLSSTGAKNVTSNLVDAKGNAIVRSQLGHAGATPEAIKVALSEVDDAIREASRNGLGSRADLLGDIKDALLEARHRGLPPEVQGMAGDINKAYTNYKQLERGFSSVAAQKQGMVSPDQMLNAIKATDRSAGKAAFARGNMPNQGDVLNAGRVLGSTLPEVGPGTFEKMALAGILGSPFALTGDLVTAGLAASLATNTGQRAMFGYLPGQGILGSGLRAAAPAAGQVSRSIMLNQ